MTPPPRIGYLMEDGYQHAFPVRALLRVRRGPVFVTGPQVAARFRPLPEVTEVIVGGVAKLAAEVAAREVDVLFTTSQNLDPDQFRAQRPGLRVVFVGHGESDKARGHGTAPPPLYVHDPRNTRFDLVLVGTHEHLRAHENPHRELVGSLRHDLLHHARLLERPPEPGLVLWAPTYGRHGATSAWLDEVVGATAKLGLRLVVHLHPFSARVEPHLVRRVQAAVLEHRHVRMARVLDLVDLMARAELLLGDVSSASWDWLLFDRPVVFLDHPGLAFAEEKGVFAVGPVLQPGDDLAGAISAERAAPAARGTLRRAAVAARHDALDGEAAARAVGAAERWWRERWAA